MCDDCNGKSVDFQLDISSSVNVLPKRFIQGTVNETSVTLKT